jgi:undecaprenyl-diphosphatase
LSDPASDPPDAPVSPPPARRLKLGEAVGLGLLHGPAELVPISSSGHLTVIPFLARWEYPDLDPDLRKAFEVVLHGATAAGLVIGLRRDFAEILAGAGPRLAGMVLASFLPPAAVGYGLEGPIERRLGTPGSIAVGLIVGGAGLIWADRSAQERGESTAGIEDGLWLGLAQAAALMPGVSRNGATLTAARRRRFTRVDANRLSWQVALPVIGAATGLKTLRLVRGGLPAGASGPFLGGALAAFGSTLASTWVVAQVGRDRTRAPFGLYRIALGSLVLRRVWRERGGAGPAGVGTGTGTGTGHDLHPDRPIADNGSHV